MLFEDGCLGSFLAGLDVPGDLLRPRGVVATTLRLICWSSITRPIDGHKPIRFQGFMIEHVPGRGPGRETEAGDRIRPPTRGSGPRRLR